MKVKGNAAAHRIAVIVAVEESEPGTFLDLLPESDRAALAELGGRRRFARGQHLMHQGEPGDRVLILLRGHGKATFVEPDGKEIVLSFRDPGDVLGELSFARSEPRSSNVVAIEPVGALAYGEAVLRESMRLKPVVPFTGFKPPQEVTIAAVASPRTRT